MSAGGNGGHGPRTVAVVGPYASGKTTLLESILWITGAVTRKGSVSAGNTVGDASVEARAHQMGTELNVATTTYLGDSYTFIDCPGSIEFLQETLYALTPADAAIVVCEPDAAKVQMLQPVLKHLTDHGIPHFIFVNKVDKATGRIRELMDALQSVSAKPLVLRQVPIWENGAVTGFVDLALDRTFVYREHAPSEVVAKPGDVNDRTREARYQMLERLADHDDHLMEELLSDVEPPRDEIFADLARELEEGLIVPVLLGSAEGDNGVRRLLKALRHECPGVARTAARLGVGEGSEAIVQVMKTVHTHSGKLSIARVLRGTLKDGAVLYRDGGDERVGGLFTMLGDKTTKVAQAVPGDVVALGRLEGVRTGQTLSTARNAKPLSETTPMTPVYSLAIAVADRKDEVKLTAALHRLHEEDPSLSCEHATDTHDMVLAGQGEIHLRVAIERLANKYALKVTSRPTRVPYKETIRKATTQHARHKKQSGGHGQFADITVDIKPLPRGSGFVFNDTITGGAVPKQYIPPIEKGVRDSLARGPLGCPVVDFAVTLTDGKYHDVDSSNEAFQIAGRQAMAEGLPNCSPVLLEPVMAVDIFVPSTATSAVNGMVSSRRGHILGFDARPGWAGWDIVSAQIPQTELNSLIVELRSATQGVGTYKASFDHLQELTGKPAEQALAALKAA